MRGAIVRDAATSGPVKPSMDGGIPSLDDVALERARYRGRQGSKPWGTRSDSSSQRLLRKTKIANPHGDEDRADSLAALECFPRGSGGRRAGRRSSYARTTRAAATNEALAACDELK